MNLINLRSSDLCWENKLTFCFSSSTSQQLIESINKHNILSPPILYPLDNNKYMIVSGWKRLLVSQQVDKNVFSFSAFVLDKRDDYIKYCFDFSLNENLTHRQLTLLEKAETIWKLKYELKIDDHDILRKYFPLMGLNRGAKILKEMLFLADLTDLQKKTINDKEFNADYLTPLAIYDKAFASLLVDAALELNLGINFIKEISLGISEIAARENRNTMDVFTELYCEVKERPRREKIEYLRKNIYKKRYPLVTKKTDLLADIIKQNAFLPQIKIKTPPSLEGSKISVSFDVYSQKELEKYLSFLKMAAENKKFEKIWDFMKL